MEQKDGRNEALRSSQDCKDPPDGRNKILSSSFKVLRYSEGNKISPAVVNRRAVNTWAEQTQAWPLQESSISSISTPTNLLESSYPYEGYHPNLLVRYLLELYLSVTSWSTTLVSGTRIRNRVRTGSLMISGKKTTVKRFLDRMAPIRESKDLVSRTILSNLCSSMEVILHHLSFQRSS